MNAILLFPEVQQALEDLDAAPIDPKLSHTVAALEEAADAIKTWPAEERLRWLRHLLTALNPDPATLKGLYADIAERLGISAEGGARS